VRPQITGVIGFYGVPAGPPRIGDAPAPAELADQMHGAVLGLFGGADPSIPPESVTEFERALDGAGVPHELHAYPGAPHSFFDRKALEFAAESADAWDRVLGFVAAHAPTS
jgi:carboxymethylenebutenolidase